jgi:hypothetical protein
MKQKRCPRCGVTKSLTMFHRDKNTADGIQGICKQCRSAYGKRKRYGTDGQSLLDAQAGKCAICEVVLGEWWCVDHKHNAARTVRGVLCCKCNRGIGYLQDSTSVLFKAIEYLRKHSTMRNYWRLVA